MTGQSNHTAIVIAAYNAAATIDRAIASALAEPEAAEICVVDDGSHDDTAARAASWAARDGRVKVLSQENGGPGAARNAAIAATQSPWIAMLDADDLLLPGRTAALHRFAGDADFVADTLMRTPQGAPIPPTTAAPFEAAPTISFETFVLGNLGALKGPLDLGFLKPMMRRSFLAQHQLRYRPELRLGEDYELYARALALGARFRVGGEAGYISIERAGSLSKAHSEDDLERLRDCDIALAEIRALSSSERQALQRHWTSVDCRLQWRRLISAVKQNNFGAALSTFHTPESALFLTTRLGEQAWLRSGAWLRRVSGLRQPQTDPRV